MTHLRIEQTTGSIEEVSSSIITKLYEIAHAGLDVSSSLLGRLHSPVGIRSLILWLTTTYPDLYINVDDYAIEFEDPKVVTYLNSIGVGSNGIVTEPLAAAATVAANSLNTEITKFNELRYFTNITTSKGGYTGYQSGNIRFMDWTALEEIDISNFTSIGHRTANSYEDTFSGCSSLKKVTASDNLTTIGFAAFRSCSNLELITGLSGVIKIASQAFLYCSKLTDESIKNVAFEPDPDSSYIAGSCFEGTLFTEIKISSDTTFIPLKAFKDCNKLERIIGGNIITVQGEAFKNCSKLTSFDFSNVEQIDKEAFFSCDLTGTLSIPNLKTLIGGHIFRDNRHLSAVNIDWSNLTNSGPVNNMFSYCTALSTIDLTGATAIGDGAFLKCSNLTTVTGLSDCETIGTSAFLDCNHLTTIDLSNVTQVGFRAFENCTSLTSLGATTFPGLTSLRAACFINCTNLTGELNFPDLTNFPFENGYRGGLFYHCEKLTKITLGHITLLNYGAPSLTGGHAFEGCSALLTLDLGDSLTAINNHLFNGCGALRSVIIRATTPPTCTGANEGIARFFGNENVKIYVPDAAVNDYKVDSGWSNIASYIYPLSEYES